MSGLTSPRVPKAFARSVGSFVDELSRESETTIIVDVPALMRLMPAIATMAFGASPASTPPAIMAQVPHMMARRRPTRSPRSPATNTTTMVAKPGMNLSIVAWSESRSKSCAIGSRMYWPVAESTTPAPVTTQAVMTAPRRRVSFSKATCEP